MRVPISLTLSLLGLCASVGCAGRVPRFVSFTRHPAESASTQQLLAAQERPATAGQPSNATVVATQNATPSGNDKIESTAPTPADIVAEAAPATELPRLRLETASVSRVSYEEVPADVIAAALERLPADDRPMMLQDWLADVPNETHQPAADSSFTPVPQDEAGDEIPTFASLDSISTDAVPTNDALPEFPPLDFEEPASDDASESLSFRDPLEDVFAEPSPRQPLTQQPIVSDHHSADSPIGFERPVALEDWLCPVQNVSHQVEQDAVAALVAVPERPRYSAVTADYIQQLSSVQEGLAGDTWKGEAVPLRPALKP